ncbi:MAG: hypothetical protein P8079_10025 [Gammaproteobacteria bacterium]|jgi:hypothetical protein
MNHQGFLSTTRHAEHIATPHPLIKGSPAVQTTLRSVPPATVGKGVAFLIALFSNKKIFPTGNNAAIMADASLDGIQAGSTRGSLQPHRLRICRRSILAPVSTLRVG